MPTLTISFTITTPTGVTTAHAIDLLARKHCYEISALEGETKAQFVKRIIGIQISQDIKHQQLQDAQKTATDVELAKPPITVE